ncbi:MAG: cobalamin B12-binding domain-containing protein [Bacillota bacterium]
MNGQKTIRVLLGKPGLDGHDRGVKVVARALRDAGMEVIYTGLHQTPDKIIAAAIQEDVDVIGLSILSGAHMTLFRKINDLVKANNMENVILMGGGTIPEEDIAEIKAKGYAQEIFTPGTPTDDIIVWIKESVANSGN